MTDRTGKWLAEQLALLGWTQQQLADRIKAHRNSIGNWIREDYVLDPSLVAYVELAVECRQVKAQLERMLA